MQEEEKRGSRQVGRQAGNRDLPNFAHFVNLILLIHLPELHAF